VKQWDKANLTIIMTDSLRAIREASDLWHAFKWNEKLVEIEETLKSTKEARDQSVTARKTLAENTKQFKRIIKALQHAVTLSQESNTEETVGALGEAVEGVTKESKAIVSSYKEEIDNLTRRCKATEGAYAALSQGIRECSDPALLAGDCADQIEVQQKQLEQATKALQTLTSEAETRDRDHKKQIDTLKASSSGTSKKDMEELIELRREVAEYEVEFRSLKNQDIKIRKLENRIAELQDAGAEQLKDQFAKAKEELEETEGKRVTEALEREAAMERKLQKVELELKAERAGREATQNHMLEADEGLSRREAAWEAQRAILIGDTERLREELHSANRERDELRMKVTAQLSTDSGATPRETGVSMKDLELERSAYEAEVKFYARNEIRILRSQVAELSETSALLREEIRKGEDDLALEKRTNQTKLDSLLRDKVALQHKVADLESQLQASPSPEMVDHMKRELRILKKLEYNVADGDREPEIAGINEDDDTKLEAVLVEKLRRAESELVTERVAKTELLKECEALRVSKRLATEQKEEAHALVASLEKDLAKASATPQSVPRKAPDNPAAVGNPALLQSVLDPDAPVPKEPKSKAQTEKAEDDHSVATIVMAQRDRLRARCEALEAERDSFKRELQGQVQASESLKTDNMKLYEKVRYLQSYTKAPASRAKSRDLDLEALEQRYEASVDPFRQFSKSERQRKLNEMSPVERTVFVVARTVLGKSCGKASEDLLTLE